MASVFHWASSRTGSYLVAVMSSNVCSDVDMTRASPSCATSIEPAGGRLTRHRPPGPGPAGVTWGCKRRISTAASSKVSLPRFLPVRPCSPSRPHIAQKPASSRLQSRLLSRPTTSSTSRSVSFPVYALPRPYLPLTTPLLWLLFLRIHYIAVSYLSYLKLILSFSSPLHFLSF